MTKQAATGNNIGLFQDFRHGNNQLQTTDKCYTFDIKHQTIKMQYLQIFTPCEVSGPRESLNCQQNDFSRNTFI